MIESIDLNKKILVTGHAGFIGSNLVYRLFHDMKEGTVIHTHHYDYYTNYFQSSLAKCPRRTNESFFLRCFLTTPEEAFHEDYPIPNGGFTTFEEMWEWHQELIEIENSLNANPI